jgi:hypothetical protein
MTGIDREARGAPSLSERVYARLLQVYPRGYRREYGPLMLQLFRDQYRDARRLGGAWGNWQLWWRIAAELATTAGREHVTELKEALMDKHTGKASVLIGGSLIAKSVIFEAGGSTVLALAVLLSAHLVAGLLIDRLIEARGVVFMLMALLVSATLLPLLWVADGREWLRENPLMGGIFVVIVAGWYQTGRPRWPMFVVAAILAAAQILVSFI